MQKPPCPITDKGACPVYLLSRKGQFCFKFLFGLKSGQSLLWYTNPWRKGVYVNRCYSSTFLRCSLAFVHKSSALTPVGALSCLQTICFFLM